MGHPSPPFALAYSLLPFCKVPCNNDMDRIAVVYPGYIMKYAIHTSALDEIRAYRLIDLPAFMNLRVRQVINTPV